MNRKALPPFGEMVAELLLPGYGPSVVQRLLYADQPHEPWLSFACNQGRCAACSAIACDCGCHREK